MAHSLVKSEWVSGNLVFYDKAGNIIFTIDGQNRAFTLASGSTFNSTGAVVSFADTIVYNKRVRSTAAAVNAGATLLPAVAGFAYRLVDFTMIAIGGNAATATSVDIGGTRSAGAVLLAVVAVAALTRSAAVKPNTANVTLLADGASHTLLDANTAVTVAKGGSDLATATNIDVIISYTIEAA